MTSLFSLLYLYFFEGFDTIIAGLQWSLLYLIKFPDIQDRIHQEIGTVWCWNVTNVCFIGKAIGKFIYIAPFRHKTNQIALRRYRDT